MKVLRSSYRFIGLLWLIGLLSARTGPGHAQVPVRVQTITPQKAPGSSPFCRTFTQADGLPTGRIRAMCQTRDGFLWLSIQHLGLVRFDGHLFRQFGTDILPSTDFRELVEGQDSALYLASDRGLCRFDLRTYKARLFSAPGPLAIVHETNAGVLLVDGPSGIYQFDKKSHRFRDVRQDPVIDGPTGRPRTDSIPSQWLDFHTSPDPLGWYWAYFGGINKSIFAYDPNRKHWLAYSTPITQASSSPLLQNKWFTKIYPDENGRYIWISGWMTGLQRLDRQSGEWVCYDFGSRTLNDCIAIAPGADQNLWLTFDGAGLARFNRQTKQIAYFPAQPIRLGGIPPGLQWVGRGQDASLWLFGAGGAFTALLPAQQRLPYQKILPARERVAVLWNDDAQDRTLFACFDAQSVSSLYLRERDGTVRSRRYPDLDMNGNSRPFRFLKSDGKGILWTGINHTNERKNGLYQIDLPTLNLEKITRRIGLGTLTTDSLYVYTAGIDVQGNLWMGTVKHGVVCLPPGTGPGRNWPVLDNRNESAVLTLLPDPDGRVWLGRQLSLQRLTPATGRLETFFPNSINNSPTRPLCIDAAGSVWASTISGVWRLRKNERRFQCMIPRLMVSQGVADVDGTLWFAASDGLYRFEPRTGGLQRLDGQNGLGLEPSETEYSDKRLLLTQRSELLLSDQYRFPTHHFRTDSGATVPLALTSFRVFDRELPLPRAIDATPGVTLTYRQNFFTVEYASLDFLPASQHRYQHRLDGLVETWQSSGNQRSVSYTNLAPGMYRFRVRAADVNGHWGRERTLAIDIRPPFWLTIWFRVIAAILLFSLAYGLYRYRIAQVKYHSDVRRREAELREREALLQQRLSETELKALRSQMNPHFIFNCLNSIKLYATENESEKASEYLTKFSRLIRLVLENSRSERVKLQNELDMLQLYADLEIMRFKQKLSFSIEVDPDLDTRFLEIPPLLLQPYVENAIWHGLMHKPEGGSVWIRATQPQEDRLQLTITDDGIGRARAAQLKSKSASHQKSFGLKITSERIALVNQLYQTHTQVMINDLVDTDGQPAGTEVILQIPL